LAENEISDSKKDNIFEGSFKGYVRLATSGVEQPQSTHADRYILNGAYGAAAYTKGSVFLAQLGYIIGQENLQKTLNRYYDEWKFKHPTPNDFIRIAEKVSGAELDWYLIDWTQTTNTIDYAVKDLSEEGETTIVNLERIGLMPMPLDVKVSYIDGTSEMIYIPLQMMRWNKPAENGVERTLAKDWAWAYPTYKLSIDKPKSTISNVQIDPAGLMADINRENNELKQAVTAEEK